MKERISWNKKKKKELESRKEKEYWFYLII
jgi:hypothetical protein